VRVLFLSDTHLGLDWPTRPRVVRRRRGDDFFQNFERALETARTGEVDVVVHGGDLLYRSCVPAWLAEAALAPLKRLASSGVPVLLVPGNHERGRLPYPLLAVHERLHVFDRPRSVVLEARGVRAAFIGFPYTYDIRRRFPELIAAASCDTLVADVRVLCLHQCIEGATCGPASRHLSGLGPFEFRPLPARPMITRTLSFGDNDAAEVHARFAAAIESTPDDAVVQLRVSGAIPAMLTAGELRAIAGACTVTLALTTLREQRHRVPQRE
jgi:DNA repair exonuclease SbcCD nuclease subunit